MAHDAEGARDLISADATRGKPRSAAAPAASEGAARPSRRGVRIVHVSDLHFGRGFDLALWEHVQALVEREAPDFVVVSGDLVNSPWPFLLAVARRELEALARRTRTVVLVVPGNHDVALLGNAYLGRARRVFRALFSAPLGAEAASGADDLLARLPTYAELRAATRWGRLKARARGYAALTRLFVRRMRGARAAGPKTPDVWHDPHGRALAVLLDSTFRGSLASGFIDERAIYGIDAEISRLQECRDLRSALALRLAVLHHHPLPLPYSIAGESLTSYEPFLVLRNAGTLLRELWKHDFDLLLHGHKHFHSYARVTYGAAREEGARMLSVLAAGSASVRHAEAGRNSFNVIEVHPNGRVVIKPTVVGGGMTLDGAPAPYVQSLPDLKARNFRRARAAQGLSARRITRRIVVDASGAGEMELKVEGLRVHGRRATRRRRHVLVVHPGRIDPTAVELCAPTPPGMVLHYEGDEPRSTLECWVDLAGLLEPDTQPATYALRFSTPNGFLASRWEALEGGEPADDSPGDYVRTHVGYPLEELVLDLTLPAWPGADAGDAGAGPTVGQPYVRCLMPRDYPALELDEEQHEVVAPDPARLELDGEMTEHEQCMLMRVGDRRFLLRVPHPMVGYTYELRWQLPERPLRSARVVGETADLRRVLLDYRAQRLAGRTPSAGEALHGYLEELRLIFAQRFASRVRDDERLVVGLMAYDAPARALVMIDGAYNWEREPDLNYSIPFGEGLAGAVFKQRRALLYARPELQRTRGGRAYLYEGNQAEARTPFEALVCVPLVHPARDLDDDVEPREVVGTLSFGSDSPSSGLLALLDMPAEESGALLGDLFEFGQDVFKDILVELVGDERVRAMLDEGEA